MLTNTGLYFTDETDNMKNNDEEEADEEEVDVSTKVANEIIVYVPLKR